MCSLQILMSDRPTKCHAFCNKPATNRLILFKVIVPPFLWELFQCLARNSTTRKSMGSGSQRMWNLDELGTIIYTQSVWRLCKSRQALWWALPTCKQQELDHYCHCCFLEFVFFSKKQEFENSNKWTHAELAWFDWQLIMPPQSRRKEKQKATGGWQSIFCCDPN